MAVVLEEPFESRVARLSSGGSDIAEVLKLRGPGSHELVALRVLILIEISSYFRLIFILLF